MFRLLQTTPSNKTVEIIKAIGSTWPFLLVVVLIIFLITYHKKIANRLSKFDKISGKIPLGEITLEKIEESVISVETVTNADHADPENENSEEETKPTSEEANFLSIYLKLKDGK